MSAESGRRAELTEVVRLEQRLLDPAVRARSEEVRSLLHPDFLEHGASGRVWDRASVVAALVTQPEVSAVATDFEPVLLADGVALLTFRVTGERETLRSSVWVWDDAAGWRLRFHQGTVVPPGR